MRLAYRAVSSIIQAPSIPNSLQHPLSAATTTTAPSVGPSSLPQQTQPTIRSITTSRPASMPYSKVDAHIAELMKRNAEFVDSTDKEALQKSAREPQTPKVFWLGCSDSRVSDTTVVGGKLGEIFVHVSRPQSPPMASHVLR